jgi:hypothetical protein
LVFTLLYVNIRRKAKIASAIPLTHTMTMDESHKFQHFHHIKNIFCLRLQKPYFR